MRKMAYSALLAFLIIILGCMPVIHADTPSLVKYLNVSNGRMIQFDKNILYYTVELNKGETIPQIVTVPFNDDCRIEVEGDTEAIYAGQKHTVTVYAYNSKGDTVTYILDVYPYGNELNGLSFLRCRNGTMAPQYRETALNYYVVLPPEQDHADLDIRPKNTSDSVRVIGNANLPQGERTLVRVIITDRRGRESSYNIFVYRMPPITSPLNPSFLLNDVQINDGAVVYNFNPYQTYYELEVPADITKLDINATAMNRSNIVQIYGAGALAKNDNFVSVIVRNPDDKSNRQSVYTFRLYHSSLSKTLRFTTLQITAVGFASFIAAGLISVGLYFGFLKKSPPRDAASAENHKSDQPEKRSEQ